MPFGTIPSVADTDILVGTTSTPTTPVGGLQSASMGGQSETTTDEFYNAFPSNTTVGPNKWTVPLSGKYLKADSGQDIVNNAFYTKDVIYVSAAPNGTDGQKMPGRVSRLEVNFANPNQATAWQATIEQAGDVADVGTGF